MITPISGQHSIWCCGFCEREFEMREFIDLIPVFLQTGDTRQLLHRDCVKPAQVARRLLKETT